MQSKMHVCIHKLIYVHLLVQVVLGVTVDFAGAGAWRKSVVGRDSPGRYRENTDLGMCVVLNSSVNT